MGYVTHHLKSDGKTESTYQKDGEKYDLGSTDYVPNVIAQPSETRGKKEVKFNFDEASGFSKTACEDKIRTHLRREKAQCLANNGMSKGGTMRKVATIPAEYWWAEKFEKGPEALRRPKELKKFCVDNNFNTVSKW